MSTATAPVLKLLSITDSCQPFLFMPAISEPSSHSYLPIQPRPIKLNLSCSASPHPLRKTHQSSFVTFVAQTSDWAQQEEEDTVTTLEQEEQVGESEWEAPEAGAEGEVEVEAQISDWEGEGGETSAEGGVFEEREGEEVEGEGEAFVEPPEDAKLFVGNLPYDIDSQKLAMLFEQAGTVEIAEVIYNRDTDQSRGFGFVTMSTVEEAEKAVDLFHKYDMNGRLLTVNKAAPRGSRPERAGPTRTFEPSFRIYVGNLPWDVDNARLEQVFSEHGKVVNARVVYDRETGRSRGFGFVTMESETEMNDAIAALDGQSLEGRAIRVNVAEERPRRGSF